MSDYRFKEPPSAPTFGPLPEGDYMATVVDCGEPYINPKSGNYVLAVKLAVGPEAVPVFYNAWAGTDVNGNERDGIAELCIALNRAPKPGQEPNWKALVGAKAKFKIKIETAQQGSLTGKPVNKVAFVYRPKQVGLSAAPQGQSFTEAELKKSQTVIAKTLVGKDPDLDVAPDDIPF